MQACFKVGNHTYCVTVPIVPLPHIPIDIPVGGGRPDPGTWLRGSELSKAAVADLSVLASFELLAGSLKSPRLRERFGSALKEFAATLDLPSDLELRMSHAGKAQTAHAQA